MSEKISRKNYNKVPSSSSRSLERETEDIVDWGEEEEEQIYSDSEEPPSKKRARAPRQPDIKEPVLSIDEARNATEDPWDHISKRTWQMWRDQNDAQAVESRQQRPLETMSYLRRIAWLYYHMNRVQAHAKQEKLESEGLRLGVSSNEPHLERSSETQNEMLYFDPQSQIETPDGFEPNFVLNEVYQRREQISQAAGSQRVIPPPPPSLGMPPPPVAYSFPLSDRSATPVAGQQGKGKEKGESV